MSATFEVRKKTREPIQTINRQISELELKPYLQAKLALIPLRRWDEKDADGKAIGKARRDMNWTARKYDSIEVIERCIEHRWNIGVRLSDTWHVIDVDPKNDGVYGFRQLCRHFWLDIEK